MRITARPQTHADEDSKLDHAAARERRERDALKWHQRNVRLEEVAQYHAELTQRARQRKTLH